MSTGPNRIGPIFLIGGEGSATWRGDMAGLDANNRAVRDGATLTVADLTDPRADAERKARHALAGAAGHGRRVLGEAPR